ncbi:MAG: hypothetical protein IJH87_00230 [Atopobiaceae bacterium]|nr:hypothetical protein [Atopobiaceae bacterium]
MDYLLTFLEGIITFISPCVLPMLPIYLAYFAGDAASSEDEGSGRALLNSVAFVVGFSVVFTLYGAFAGRFGAMLASYQSTLNAVCGIFVVVLGLNYLGVLRITILDRTFKPDTGIVPTGFASSLLFGIVFAIGWTPCVGTFLASALSLAAGSANTVKGVALLLSYSLGLGIPFILSAVLIRQLEGAFKAVREHYRIIDMVCGVFLIIVGFCMATGSLSAWIGLFSS